MSDMSFAVHPTPSGDMMKVRDPCLVVQPNLRKRLLEPGAQKHPKMYFF